MSKTGNSLLALFAGIMVGAVAGVLYAPDKGANTRDRFAYRLERFKSRLEDLLVEITKTKDSLPDSVAKSDGEKVISDAREKARQLLNDVDTLLEQIKHENKD